MIRNACPKVSLWWVLLIVALAYAPLIYFRATLNIEVCEKEEREIKTKSLILQHDDEIAQHVQLTPPWEWKGVSMEEKLTLVMVTYMRADIYRGTIEHYICNPGLQDIIYEVLLLWNTPADVLAPPESSSFNCSRIPVTVVQMEFNEIQNRQKNFWRVKTRAIFQLDDDLRVQPEDVHLAWLTWRSDPSRLVGFTARRHKKNDIAGEWEYEKTSHKYSIVIGSAIILDRYFYEFYSSSHPVATKVRDYVGERRCCDDIGLNALVSWLTGRGPVWVRVPRGTVKTTMVQGWQGQANTPNWENRRSLALNDMALFFYSHLPGGFAANGMNSSSPLEALPLVLEDVIVTRESYFSFHESSRAERLRLDLAKNEVREGVLMNNENAGVDNLDNKYAAMILWRYVPLWAGLVALVVLLVVVGMAALGNRFPSLSRSLARSGGTKPLHTF